MGVYIKNMKMPGACLACDFCNPFAEEPYCRRLMKITPKTTTLPDCPLVELPPHGRLGDLDTLKKKALIRSERRGRLVNVTDMVISAYDIETAPTIIEAEE